MPFPTSTTQVTGQVTSTRPKELLYREGSIPSEREEETWHDMIRPSATQMDVWQNRWMSGKLHRSGSWIKPEMITRHPARTTCITHPAYCQGPPDIMGEV